MVVRVTVPQPPYAVELIADLHADNLPPAIQAQLWPLVRRDPDAVRVLHALDRVSDELRALGHDHGVGSTVPADVADRLDRALGLDPRLGDAEDAQPSAPVRTVSRVAIAESTAAAAPRRRRWVVAAAAVGSVAATTALLFAATVIRAPEPGTPVIASPQGEALNLGSEIAPATMMSLLGRHDASSPLADRSARSACLVANGLDPARPTLGSATVTFRGEEAVLLLVPGPRSPQITALVVRPGCGPSNPSVLARTDIG